MQLTSITSLKTEQEHGQKTSKTSQLDLITQLQPLFETQGKFFRTVFNQLYWNNYSSKEITELWKQFCSIDYLCDNGYCFGTKYANSLFQDAKTKAKLHQEEKSFRLKEIEDKIEDLIKYKTKLENEINLYKKKKAFIYHNKETFLKTKTKLYWLNRELEKLASLKQKLIKAGVTFGTKSYQRKLSLKQTTTKVWRRRRNNFIYAVGRSERKSGNDSIHLDLGNNTLQIELDRNLLKLLKDRGNEVEKEEKNLHNVQNQITQDVFQVKSVDKKCVNNIPVKFNYLLDELKHIHKKTHRIVLRKKKLELHTTIDLDVDIYDKSSKDLKTSKTILGVDFNSGHLDYYLNDKNYAVYGTIDFDISSELNKQQREQNLRNAIKQICLIAEQHNVNQINIEDLNFNRKKRKLFSSNNEIVKKYNKMLSNLPYSQYLKIFEVEMVKRAFRAFESHKNSKDSKNYKNFITLKRVNPKNTSQEALKNEKEKNSLGRHIGAAKIIASK